MKCYFKFGEQVKSPLKLIKYSACHIILRSSFQREIFELLPPIERRFDDTSMIRDLPGRILETDMSRSGYLLKCHEVLRPPRKVIVHPNNAPATENESHD